LIEGDRDQVFISQLTHLPSEYLHEVGDAMAPVAVLPDDGSGPVQPTGQLALLLIQQELVIDLLGEKGCVICSRQYGVAHRRET
jgi:hypothetical protein